MRSTLVPAALLSLLSLSSAAAVSARSSECGVVGYDKANPKAVFFRKDDAESATFEGCQTLCKANSRCVSFAIGNGECLLYPTSIGDNVRVDSRSPFTFFAVDCAKPEPPKPSPSSSSSSSSSSPASPVAAAQVSATATNASSAPSTGNGPANQNQNPSSPSPTASSGSESPSSSPASSSSSPDAGAPANKPNAASSVTAASGLVMGSLVVLQMLL